MTKALLGMLCLLLHVGSAFVHLFDSNWVTRTIGLHAQPQNQLLFNLDVTSVKPSLKTYMHFFLIGEEGWRSDSTDTGAIECSNELGKLEVFIGVQPPRLQATRLDVRQGDTYLKAEAKLMQALLEEIDQLASNPDVDPTNRLVQLEDGAIEKAKRSLLSAMGGSKDGGDQHYDAARQLLEKKERFEKGVAFMKEFAKKQGLGGGGAK